MAKQLIKRISDRIALYRDLQTGLAFVENGSAGVAHSAHPNIHASGSVRGMKKRGGWDEQDRTVRCGNFIYNVDICIIHDDLDQLAAEHCDCGGKHNR